MDNLKDQDLEKKRRKAPLMTPYNYQEDIFANKKKIEKINA